MHGSRQLGLPITQAELKTKMLLLMSATHNNRNILLQLVNKPEPEKPASPAGGSSYFRSGTSSLALY